MPFDRISPKRGFGGPPEEQRIAERKRRIEAFGKFSKGVIFKFRDEEWIVTGPMTPTGFVPYRKINGKTHKEFDALRNDPNSIEIVRRVMPETDDTE